MVFVSLGPWRVILSAAINLWVGGWWLVLVQQGGW